MTENFLVAFTIIYVIATCQNYKKTAPYQNYKLCRRIYLLFRDITLNEALDLLEDVNDACDLYIEPLDVAVLTKILETRKTLPW